jgi:hypothetical protein
MSSSVDGIQRANDIHAAPTTGRAWRETQGLNDLLARLRNDQNDDQERDVAFPTKPTAEALSAFLRYFHIASKGMRRFLILQRFWVFLDRATGICGEG